MKKIFLIILLNLISSNIYSQTFEETATWISNNTRGSQQILYDEENNLIEFISVKIAGNLQSAFVNSFNPEDVVSISTLADKKGQYYIKLNFKTTGTLVTKKWYDKNLNLVGDIDRIKMYAFDIYVNCDKEMVERYKKAFINLFKQIGVTVKNGDIF